MAAKEAGSSLKKKRVEGSDRLGAAGGVMEILVVQQYLRKQERIPANFTILYRNIGSRESRHHSFAMFVDFSQPLVRSIPDTDRDNPTSTVVFGATMCLPV